MSNEDVKKFRVVPLTTDEPAGSMEPIGLFDAEGNPVEFGPFESGQTISWGGRTLTFDEEMSGFVFTGNGPDDDSEFYLKNDPDGDPFLNIYGNLNNATMQLGPAYIHAEVDHISFNSDLWFNLDGIGPCLKSPDGGLHRLKVANDGTLSTEVVA